MDFRRIKSSGGGRVEGYFTADGTSQSSPFSPFQPGDLSSKQGDPIVTEGVNSFNQNTASIFAHLLKNQ